MEYTDGKKYCKGCDKTKIVDAFEFGNKAKTYRAALCIECRREPKREAVRKHYRANTAAYATRRDRSREKVVLFVRQYKIEHPVCMDCKLPHPYWRLDFDHLRDKQALLSRAASDCWSLTRIVDEMAKCEIVCANCHRDRTQARRGELCET
jgi:hypothetical protein